MDGAVAASTPTSNTPSEPTAESATSHYDPEGYDEDDAPGLSPEVIEYDKKIPLIAAPGNDRRNRVPKHIMDEVHDFLDDIHQPVTSAPRNETRADSRELREDESARAQARADAALTARQTETHRASYLDMDDSRDARKPQEDRVAGPSFLGLGNSDYEYVYDDQRPSHWRRNFSLLVLVVLAVLAAVQWHSIRDMGLEYAKNGTINVHVPKRSEQTPDANANQQSSAANSNGNGAPNMSVAPTRNADAENAKLKAEEDAARAPQPSQQQNNSAASATTPPALPAADTATTDDVSNTRAANKNSADRNSANNSPANSQPAPRAGNNTPSAMGASAGSANTVTEEATPSPTRAVAASAPSKRNARLPAATSPSVPGTFEMQQATALGQVPSAVPWLWSALGKGNPDAPVKLADMYLTGHGVEKSCDQGLVILRSAAARGNARASARLGTLYATGICVPQNRVQAYEWMGTAAGRSPSLSSWAEQYRQSLWQQMTPDERARVR